MREVYHILGEFVVSSKRILGEIEDLFHVIRDHRNVLDQNNRWPQNLSRPGHTSVQLVSGISSARMVV
jgi:hypothetical protein